MIKDTFKAVGISRTNYYVSLKELEHLIPSIWIEAKSKRWILRYGLV
jgi:hypothetical protein